MVPESYLQAVVGAFKVHKAFFDLDAEQRFRQVGDISARGIESSVTLTGLEGLAVVAGGVWLQPEVHSQIAQQAGSKRTPVGPVPLTLNINADWAPKRWRGWGVTFQTRSLSSRVQTADGAYRLPSLTTLDVGMRYIHQDPRRTVSARLDVGNVTNARGLLISTDHVALPQLRRNYVFTLTADL